MGPEEYIYSLREASSLDYAAAEVQRISNSRTDLPPQQAEQRKAILTVAYKLIMAERDKHLKILKSQIPDG